MSYICSLLSLHENKYNNIWPEIDSWKKLVHTQKKIFDTMSIKVKACNRWQYYE